MPLDYEPDELSSSNKGVNAPTPLNNSSCIIPLAIGNQWTTKVTEWDFDGDITSSRYQTTKIIGDTTVADEHWFIMKHPRGSVICMNGSEGFYELRSGTKILVLKYPASVGDSYQAPDGPEKILSQNAKLSVPKGSFVCYQYELTLTRVGDLRIKNYYCPGVGLIGGQIVRANRNGTGGSIAGMIELVDYVVH